MLPVEWCNQVTMQGYQSHRKQWVVHDYDEWEFELDERAQKFDCKYSIVVCIVADLNA